jgi:hypothetical protein
VKHALKKEYMKKIKKAPGSRKHMLKSEYSRRLRDFKSSLVKFKGHSRWDGTSISEEYTHGNGESMMVLQGADFDNYYFFMDGRLWKWVRTMPARSFRSYKKFSRSIEKKFGNGYEKQGETTPGSGREYRFIEFLDRNSRLRAVDRSSAHRDYALIFEEMATVRNLHTLRPGTPSPRQLHQKKLSEKRERAEAAKREKAAKEEAKRRSVFSHERRGETDREYQERKRRVQEKNRRAQEAKYERKRAAKRAKALEALKGLEDDDPLAGVK